MRRSLLVAPLLAVLFAADAVEASPIIVPAGLNPGDQYRLTFVTSATRNAVGVGIPESNAFVSSVASGVPELAALGTAWRAIASTSSVHAKDNTGTNPSTAGVPIYELDGQLVASGNADFWDGNLMSPIDRNEHGNSRSGVSVWTGTWSNGMRADKWLGGDDPYAGNTTFSDYRWAAVSTPSWTFSYSFYAVSDVLTVPVPEPTTSTLFTVGLLLGLTQRRRRVFA